MHKGIKNVLLFSVICSMVSIVLVFGLTIQKIYAPTISYFARSDKNADQDGRVSGVSSDINESDLIYLDRLAIHLNEAGFILYGTFWSEETLKQKDLFKDSLKFINYVECDQAGANSNIDECLANKVSVYPTWVCNSVKYEGLLELGYLAEISDFQANASWG